MTDRQIAAQQGMGLRIRLHLETPNLVTLPWEFLYDQRQGDYVCLSRNSPVVRYLDLPQEIKPLNISPPLRILCMVASPVDLEGLEVAREKELVDRAVESLEECGLVDLVWSEGPTWRDLQKMMREGPWHVFHFIGHGGFDEMTDEGYIALEKENRKTDPLHAKQLARLLADHTSLRLVVLNSCEGARSSQRDIISSTSSILVRRGIPAVVAMQYAISDQAAIEFSRSFYESIAAGYPVDTSMAEARKAVIRLSLILSNGGHLCFISVLLTGYCSISARPCLRCQQSIRLRQLNPSSLRHWQPDRWQPDRKWPKLNRFTRKP